MNFHDGFIRCLVLELCSVFCLVCLGLPVEAQGVRDSVKEHLKRTLEEPKEKRAEKKQPRKKPQKKKSEKKGIGEKPGKKKEHKGHPKQTKPSASKPRPVKKAKKSDMALKQEGQTKPKKKEEEKGPKLPLRVIDEDCQIDLIVGSGYRGWLAQQYPNVEVDMANYYTWTVGVKGRFFRKINLHHAYYESNQLSGPRTSEASVAAQVGSYVPKAAWLLGMIGFPFFKVWEPKSGKQ